MVAARAFASRCGRWVVASAFVAAVVSACAAGGFVEPSVAPGRLQVAEVVSVTDGDTIVVRIGDEEREVRYIGIDAPEEGTECLASEATDANGELVDERTVELERDVSDIDRFGRLLRYVWLETDDGRRMVNRELVRAGFAAARDYPPDVRYADELAGDEIDARAAERGIWGDACAP